MGWLLRRVKAQALPPPPPLLPLHSITTITFSKVCNTHCVPIRYLLSVGNNDNNSALKNTMPTFMVITFFKMPATTLCLGTSAASTLRKDNEKSHKVFINFASFSIREVVLFLAFFRFFLHRLHHLVLSDLGKRLLIHSSPPFSLTLSLAALLKSLSLFHLYLRSLWTTPPTLQETSKISNHMQQEIMKPLQRVL